MVSDPMGRNSRSTSSHDGPDGGTTEDWRPYTYDTVETDDDVVAEPSRDSHTGPATRVTSASVPVKQEDEQNDHSAQEQDTDPNPKERQADPREPGEVT